MPRPLTKQQQRVYDFIRSKILERGYGPTVREIGEHMDIKSPNGVMCHLRALQQKGAISRKKHKSRAIELTEELHRSPEIELPMVGTVSRHHCHANSTADAKANFSALFHGEGRAALRVQDDSLLEVHIQAGDTLVVCNRTEVQSGQLAIVRITGVDGNLIQVLRFVRQVNGQYQLHAANRALPATTVDRLDVIGVVIGVVRCLNRG